MATQLLELNEAQALVYTRTNIRRAFADFDDTDVAGIYLLDDVCRVIYRDGAEVDYPRQQIKDAFVSFSSRLKDFFSYLGPNYRGPSVWHQNAYIMFKGWSYVHALGHTTVNAKLQAQWADKFIHITNQDSLKALLQSEQTDLGYLVAPDGMRLADRPIDMDADLDESTEQRSVLGEPVCTCGSFQRQLNHLAGLQEEISGYRPACIHLTWFNKYRELLCKRTEVRNACPAYAPDKCVAWWYAPPTDATSDGKFVLLHTKYGAQAPLTHWRTYKPKEVFTQDDAWTLFDNMLESGYVPFPGIALPQLKTAIKHDQ
jgi:hypothetical protein